jgi:hypothetical protein
MFVSKFNLAPSVYGGAAQTITKVVKEDVDSLDRPEEAKGWMIATQPSEWADTEEAYESTLAQYGARRRRSLVMDAVLEVIDETENEEMERGLRLVSVVSLT